MLGRSKFFVLMIAVFVIITFFYGSKTTVSTNSTAGAGSSLVIWDDADSEGGNKTKLTYPSYQGDPYYCNQDKIPQIWWNVTFYANYTNSTGDAIGNGNCTIRFNETGSYADWHNMTYDPSSKLYKYYRNFTYRGFLYWDINCTSETYDNLNVTDNVFIKNTGPCIFGKEYPGGPLPSMPCDEDSACYYNFSANCTDDDFNDLPLSDFSILNPSTGFSINTATGLVTINVTNVTNNNQTDSYNINLTVRDSAAGVTIATKIFYINPVNDPPQFTNLPDYLNTTQNDTYYLDVNATDEEDNTPFYFNITFWPNCTRPYGDPGNCSIFTINETTGEINFTSDNSLVGNYTINFTVRDSGQTLLPYNATNLKQVSFSVINLNDPPNMSYVPNQNMTQGYNFNLTINGTDIDNDTLTFNITTFYLNLTPHTNTSLFPIWTNNTQGIMNFTVRNDQVGNYTLNITLSDGNPGGLDWQLVNFTVYNVNDPPILTEVGNQTAVQWMEFYLDVNATDLDQQTPYGDTLTYYLNFTWCDRPANQSNCSIFDINQTTGVINFTAGSPEVGNYSINISVNDTAGANDWEIINLTVVANEPPNITEVIQNQLTTQGENFTLIINATDPDNNTLTFYTYVYYLNLTQHSNSTTLFPITTDNSSYPIDPTRGVMSYTPVNNSQVGNYTIKIVVRDIWTAEDYQYVNFTVYNINDPPNLTHIGNQTAIEDTEYYYDVNATDPDLETPYGDVLTFNITFLNGTSRWGINSSTGGINFTAANDSWVENYTVNITVTDSNGSVSWEVLNFTILPVNDPPRFDPPLETMNKTTLVNLEYYYDVNATDEENNTPFYFNLTFLTGTQFFEINSTTGVINFTANNSQADNYTINISVTDSGSPNATNWTVFNFTVIGINYPPEINSIITVPSVLNITENDTVYFFTNITDPNQNDVLTCYWYVNGTLNQTKNACQNGGVGMHLVYRSTFDDSAYSPLNITLIVSDSQYQDRWNTSINVTNKNRPPYLYFQIPNQTWNMNTDNSNIRLDYYFRDPDNENNATNDDNNLTYTSTDPPNIDVLINNVSSVVTLSPMDDWWGMNYIVFNISDGQYYNESNNVTLNVTYVEPITQTVYQPSGGSSGTSTTTVTQTVTKIASLTVTVSPLIKIEPNQKIIAPVVLENTGEVDLSDISLSSILVNKTEDITLTFTKSVFTGISVGMKEKTNLTITSYNLTKDRYDVKITAKVTSPKFNQSTTIYLETIPINKTRLETEIRVVKDLFEENPECMDLTELILEAENELGKNNLEKARELTQKALDNCRDLVNYSARYVELRQPRREEPVTLIISAVAIILLFSIVSGYYYMRQKEVKKPGGKTRV